MVFYFYITKKCARPLQNKTRFQMGLQLNVSHDLNKIRPHFVWGLILLYND